MKPSEYQPFAPEVHDYVGGRMSAEAERDFTRKLGQSPELQQQVESLRRTMDLLGSLPAHEPKPGFDERVIGRIREEELADRARTQIRIAPRPLWQHAVQVGVGAAAAALILAVLGMPGMFHGDNADADELEGLGGSSVSRVTATEDDLLPALADHQARFDSLRRNVSFTRVDDPDLQRQLISMELQYSDLMRRNRWLADQIADLPASRRAEYQLFLEQMDSALQAVNNEVMRSRTAREAVDMPAVVAALNEVSEPRGKLGQYRVSVSGGATVENDPAVKVASSGTMDEITLYSLVRKAEYRHDYKAMIEAADFYLKWQGSGRFKDQANASAIAANLRLGNDDAAATRFINTFGAYDEDLSAEQQQLIRGFLTGPEYERLVAARKAQRD